METNGNGQAKVVRVELEPEELSILMLFFARGALACEEEGMTFFRRHPKLEHAEATLNLKLRSATKEAGLETTEEGDKAFEEAFGPLLRQEAPANG